MYMYINALSTKSNGEYIYLNIFFAESLFIAESFVYSFIHVYADLHVYILFMYVNSWSPFRS